MSLRDDVENWICEHGPIKLSLYLPGPGNPSRSVIVTVGDMTCMYCGEPIDKEAVVMRPNVPVGLHYECAMRGVVGSVGHLTGRCRCYGGGFDDPPGMSIRQAAKEAVRVWEKMNRGEHTFN